MATHTITIADEDVKYRDFALGVAQKALGDDAPKDATELVRRAFDTLVMAVWKDAYREATVANIQQTLNQADDATKAATIEAISALQTMTPEEQRAALLAIAQMKKTGDNT